MADIETYGNPVASSCQQHPRTLPPLMRRALAENLLAGILGLDEEGAWRVIRTIQELMKSRVAARYESVAPHIRVQIVAEDVLVALVELMRKDDAATTRGAEEMERIFSRFDHELEFDLLPYAKAK